MLSDTHWQIIHRWWGLLAASAFVFAVIGMQLLPGLLGKPAPYSSSVTLGVGSFVSPDGSAPGETALASYADSVSKSAKSQQFLSRLATNLATQGLVVPSPELAQKITATPDLGLHRVKLEATGDSPEQTELIADQAAKLLIADVAAEQTRLRDSLDAATLQRTVDLQNRLSTVYVQRVDRLRALNLATYELSINSLIRQGREFDAMVDNLARLTGDGLLASLNLEATAIEDELSALATSQSVAGSTAFQALFLVDPVQTVPTNLSSTLGGMEAAVLGGLLGLVLGWIGANFAERLRPRESEGSAETPEPPLPSRAIALLKTAVSHIDVPISSGPARHIGGAKSKAQAQVALSVSIAPEDGPETPAVEEAVTAEKTEEPATEPEVSQPAAKKEAPEEKPAAEKVVDHKRRVPSVPVMVGWKTVYISPLSEFGEMYDLKKALASLPGIEQVQVNRFEGDVLELEIEYLEGCPLSERLRELEGFGKTKVVEENGHLEMAIGKARRN